MHSGFQIPEIQNHQQLPESTTCAPVFLSMNQAHILDQIHTLPATQQLFLEQHHFLPPHHYVGGASGGGGSSPYFPAVNFKLGLNEICSRNELQESSVGGGDALLQRNERFEVPETRHSLGILHCWQNQQDSAIKQPQRQPFWEPLPSEVSNENSEIVDRQEHMELSQRDSLAQFGELEAIYERLGTSGSNQHKAENQNPNQVTVGEEAASLSMENARKKRRKRRGSYSEMMRPMAEFFGNLVKQMMEHEETLSRKFTEMIERLDEERRAREESWRVQAMAHFEKEAEARAREKTLAKSREAMIVSYLEKLTGQRIGFASTETTSTSRGGGDEVGKAS